MQKSNPDAGMSGESTFVIGGIVLAAPPLAPGLRIVATPIGHLGDITIRALETLAAADSILAEDTRVTHRLLERYGIATRTERHDAHAPAHAIERLVARMRGGESLALVSDAGMPLISDPGDRLVAAAIRASLPVTVLPGASSTLAALALSGLPAAQFLFAGFLPPKQNERRRAIQSLASIDAALVFFEAPHRVAEALADLAAILGDRPAAAARELTKTYEEVVRGTLPALAGIFAEREARGEFVLVVAAPEEGASTADDDEIERRLLGAMLTLSPRDAASVVAADLGLPRRAVYAAAVKLAASRQQP
jgi:16S rRNA (cytidine1402-2'-O)-methyltransferase